MKLRTSFFNRTALCKDILRYAPIWALYTICLLLVLLGESSYSRAALARDVADSMTAMTWINLLYGGICGVFLFMDLFNNRLCNALHAFPLRREGWLTTHLLSGFLFGFVPNLLAAGVGALLLWQYAYIAPLWLAVSMLQFLFFFGTASLAATCAGNLLGMAAVYGMIHFVTYFIYVVADLFYQPLLPGVRFTGKGFLLLFPLGKMSEFEYIETDVLYDAVEPTFRYEGWLWEQWLYVGLCAATGILAMCLACMVYRRRNLENAGDFISLKPLAPLFILVCTIGAGAFLYVFSDLFGNSTYLFLVLGMIIGYFAGKMLLNRTLRVFGKRSILTLVALMVVFGCSLLLTWIDPLGVTTYIPKTEKVEAVYIYGADKGYYYYSEFSIGSSAKLNENDFSYTDPAEIADWQDFHRQLIQYTPSEDDDGAMSKVEIFYKLKSGRIISRHYKVGCDTPLGKKLGEYFSDMRYIFQVNDTTVLYTAFESANINLYFGEKNYNFGLKDTKEISNLLDAVAADCEAGNMAQNWAYHYQNSEFKESTESINEGYVEFYVMDAAYDASIIDTPRFHLTVYPDSTNTINCLLQMAQLHKDEIVEDQPILDPLPE